MDTTPIHNRLTVRVRNVVEDIVTGADNGVIASTDGKIFSASVVNQRLHESYAWIVNELVARLGIDEATDLLTDSTTQQTLSLSSSGTTVNKDYLYPVDFLQGTVSFAQGTKHSRDGDYDPYLDNAYAIDTGKAYAYTRSGGVLTILPTGSATFYYLKSDRIDTSTGTDVAVNTTPDITLNTRWHEACIFYTAFRLCADKNVAEWADKAKGFQAMALSYLPQKAILDGVKGG